MLVGDVAEIGDFIAARLYRDGIAAKALVRGSDQREILLERQHEHDPPVRGLNDVGAIVLEQTPNDDVAAFIETRRHGCRILQHAAREQLDPWSGRVDEDARAREIAPPAHVENEPPSRTALRPDAARAGADHRTTFGG